MLLSVASLASLALAINPVRGLLIPSSAASPHDLAPRSDTFPRALTPLERQPVQCHREADFPGHADVNWVNQWEAVHAFCDKMAPEVLTSTIHDPAMGRFPVVFKHRMRWKDWPHRINYDFFVEWVRGCRTEHHFQKLSHPLGKGRDNCYTIMRDNYVQCNNGGVGGSTQAGCLLYTFTGAKGGKCILTDEEIEIRKVWDKQNNIVRPKGSCDS
ncbi:hypothetical protein LX36DRAFT_431550 [Colletotrichum falcatum]|nr:hypothetical protein LX36DRAFT_431550 [Colletotrichum falcatum]